MTPEQKRVIQAARNCAEKAKTFRSELEKGNYTVVFNNEFEASVTALITALDALDRAEATSMFDAVDALNGRIPDSDVCECGHRRSSHALSSQGTYRCFEVCECNHYRPKQKGGE